MADFSSFTHKWRAVLNNTTDSNKVSKRNRQPVSCQPCRIRKLKCDRGHPCEACVKRNDDDSCHYGKSLASAGGGGGGQHQSKATTSNGHAQDRLRHLEDLVRQMIDPQTLNHVTASIDPTVQEQTSTGDGPLSREIHGTNYKGSTHWSAILDSIHDLRASLSSVESPDSFGDSTTSPYDANGNEHHGSEDDTQYAEMALFASRPPLPLPQLLAKYLPPRKDIDRLLSIYFNSKYVPIPFVHTQQFSRQYERFWDDENGPHASPMWLSILFSILSMADKIRMAMKVEFAAGINPTSANNVSPETQHNSSISSNASPDGDASSQSDAPIADDKSMHTSVGFLTASAHLLVLGDYTKPQQYLIEALCIHNQAKYSLSLDPNRETLLILGMLVRQAYSMSYHRDCSNFPPGQFTVFEAEMRRRTWAAIKQFDLMSSFQYGIPMNVSEGSWDTKPPRNLMDTDFDEDTKVLPEARRDGEPTQMLYFVFKTKLMDVYAKILRHTLSFPQADSSTHENTKAVIMNLDAEMRRVAESVPTVMKVRPMSLSFSDPSWLIMLRSNLMFVVQKSLCVLHRKYMTNEEAGPQGDSTYSRKVVVEAASKMVNYFLELYAEFQPGGQLSRDWWMLGGFTVNDFLLAIMLLCFALWTKRRTNLGRGHAGTGGIENGNSTWLNGDDEVKDILRLLAKAKGVCEAFGKTSQESRRVAEVLKVVLDKYVSPTTTNEQLTSEKDTSPNYYLNMTGGTIANSSPRQSAADVKPTSLNGDQERLDITPLSIHEHDTPSLSQGMHSSGVSTNTSTPDMPDHEHVSATWDMYRAVPYKKSARQPRQPLQGQRPRQPQQQQQQDALPTTAVISALNDAPAMPSQTRHESKLQQPDLPSGQTFPISSDMMGAGIGTGTTSTATATAVPSYDPFPNMLDGIAAAAAGTDPIDMDWVTFDQFLGTFNATGNFSFNSTPAATPGPSLSSLQHRYDLTSMNGIDASMPVPMDVTMLDGHDSRGNMQRNRGY